ncbi:MAG: DMT family transporter [Oscillospiraceae bacterium]|nr:DMT family transporter [Oscillospiraceae bacterium]
MTLYSSFNTPLVFGSLLWILYAIFLIFAGLAARPKAGTTEWIHRVAQPAAFDVNTVALAKRADPLLALIVLVAAILLRTLPFCLTGPVTWQAFSNSLPHCLTVAIGSAVAWLGACQLTGSRLSGLLSAFLAFCLFCLSNAQDYGATLAFVLLLPACTHTWLLPLAGLLMGLGSGLFYALYSIFGRYALVHYKPFTVTFYTFLVAGIGSAVLTKPEDLATIAASPRAIVMYLCLMVFSTVLPYLLYTKGLHDLGDSGTASILASIEPVVASLVGILAFGEPLTLGVVLGLACILISIYILR